MSTVSVTAGAGTDSEEIPALIEALSAAEERLELLMGGQVDAVMTRGGRTFMLQRSQTLMRQHEAIRQAAILDALPASVALVDGRGFIVSVNGSWTQFASENSLSIQACGVGVNYLEVCERAQGEDATLAHRVAAGMRAVIQGTLPSFSVEYACHSESAQRWFVLMVSPLAGGTLSGAVVTHFDVTERSLAQHAMQRSSELLKAVISGTPDHVFVKDREGRYLLCNESLAQFMGHTVDEMIGKSNADLRLVDREILTSEAAIARVQMDRRVMAIGRPISSEDVLGGPAGQRTYLATKVPYRDERGEVIGVIGISRDITQRKDAERSLRESQALLSMSSRLALVGSWYTDVPPTKVVWSEALVLMHEEPPGFEPTFTQAIAYYIPEHRNAILEIVEACISEGTEFDCEYQLVTAKGNRIWIRAIGEAVRDADGKIFRVQGACQDVSDRKRAEHQTRLLADRLTDLLGSITDGLLTLDRDWRFTFVNSEALRLLGRPNDSLAGCNIWEELPALAGTDFQRGLRQAMQAKRGSQFDVYFASWQGWFGVNCYPSKTGISVYFSDVTQRRKDQDALRGLNADLEVRVLTRTVELTQAREDAEQANRAKSAFLAAMSHEIRTPMNGVVGMIDVLEQTKLKSSQAKIVQTIRESSYALLRIVDDVLDFSKIEAGQFHIDRDPISLESVVRQVRDTLEHMAAGKGVRLKLFLDSGLPSQVLGDSQRLRQVLLNLVGNAIKFSADTGRAGAVGLRTELIQLGARQCRVEFVIEDNGIGMNTETLERLFTPFMQADSSTTKRFGGTGLGLSISYRLAELMGGTIRVTSQPGQGSCFTLGMTFDWLDAPSSLTVDAQEAPDSGFDSGQDAESVTRPMELAAVAAWEAGRLILVAEDNEINQQVIRQQLALMGYTVQIAANGREALDLWRSGSHALLLTDLHMPELDGYELATTIRREEMPGTRIPIVALTANASKGEIKRCKDVDIDAHMTKPLRLPDLHAMLEKWMPMDAQPFPLRSLTTSHQTTLHAIALNPRSAPAVDLAILSSIVGSDPQVIREVLSSFRGSAAHTREAIRIDVAAGACQAVADSVHALKSAARSIGALRLAAICDEMEVSADAGRSIELSAQFIRFESEYGDVHRFLDASDS